MTSYVVHKRTADDYITALYYTSDSMLEVSINDTVLVSISGVPMLETRAALTAMLGKVGAQVKIEVSS